MTVTPALVPLLCRVHIWQKYTVDKPTADDVTYSKCLVMSNENKQGRGLSESPVISEGGG